MSRNRKTDRLWQSPYDGINMLINQIHRYVGADQNKNNVEKKLNLKSSAYGMRACIYIIL